MKTGQIMLPTSLPKRPKEIRWGSLFCVQCIDRRLEDVCNPYKNIEYFLIVPVTVDGLKTEQIIVASLMGVMDLLLLRLALPDTLYASTCRPIIIYGAADLLYLIN